MKVVFDTNVYIAEALLGAGASRLVQATVDAGWRIYVSKYLLDEFERVMTERLEFSRRFAVLSRLRIVRRANATKLPLSRHTVPDDPNDSPILRTAIVAGADYLITNDRHLLDLDPYEGLRIVSMNKYSHILENAGLLRRRK
jgi:uncharacterized protein